MIAVVEIKNACFQDCCLGQNGMLSLFIPIVFSLSLFCSSMLLLGKFFPSIRFGEKILWFLILASVLCWVYAEGASLFNAIGYTSARYYWGGVLLIEILLLGQFLPVGRRSLKEGMAGYLKGSSSLFNKNKAIILASFLIVVPLMVLAVYVPPNNFDSNNYHLHRIIAWLHFGNLGFYPTPYLQQLYLNVLAEYLVLNVYLVTGSDQFVNLVQFFAGMGCLSGVVLLAKELGLGRYGQLLAGFTLLTVPIFIFELTTTQVELVACCFFTAFLYFGLRLTKKITLAWLLGMGISLSLSVFAKYPTALFAIPFCCYFGVVFLRKYGIARSTRILAVMVASIALIFAPFWSRNYALFGNVMNPEEGSLFAGEKLTADAHSVKLSISNVLKNTSIHLGVPHAGFNRSIEGFIVRLHEAIGVDVDDPAISRDSFDVRYTVHEDMVPNTIHFLVIILLPVMLLFLKGNREMFAFWLLAFGGFLLFCTVLKFQHWSTRTHLPFFVMGAVLTGFVLERAPVFLRRGVLLLFFVPALFFVVGNPAKPVVPVGYLVKKLIGHLPVYLCVNPGERSAYEREVSDWYDFESGEGDCFPLRSHPTYVERREAFAELDELGYFNSVKETVFSIDRTELYFLNDPGKLADYKALMPEIKGDRPGVGVMGHMGDGFYFYQAALKASTGIEADFDYIYASSVFSSLENASRKHCYQYILTDDPELVYSYFTADQIARVVSGKELFLVCLKKPSCGRFYF